MKAAYYEKEHYYIMHFNKKNNYAFIVDGKKNNELFKKALDKIADEHPPKRGLNLIKKNLFIAEAKKYNGRLFEGIEECKKADAEMDKDNKRKNK